MTTLLQPYLFVGGYGPASQTTLRAFRFDSATGALAPAGEFSGLDNPAFLAPHPNGRWLYIASESGPTTGVWAARLDFDPVRLTLINQQSSGGEGPCHVTLDASGRWLFVTNYTSGSAAIFPIGPDGALGERTDFQQHRGSGPNPARQEGPHAHSTTLTLDNRFALVADLGLDQVIVYALDLTAGRMQPYATVPTPPGAGPRHMAFHPDGQRLYVANELDSTVIVYDYSAAAGRLRQVQALSTLPPGASESSVADIHVAPSGQRVYVSNRGHDSLAVYAVGPDGRLTTAAIEASGGRCPRNFALAPGGAFVIVGNQNDDRVCVLPLGRAGREVGAPVAQESMPQAACLQFIVSPPV